MHAMLLRTPRAPLEWTVVPTPAPRAGEILVEVHACGVCRTDLHVVDGELPPLRLPLIPGHEIVGIVAAAGAGVTAFARGDRVGVPWLGATCGVCGYCTSARENLCDAPQFTGYTRDGGYAQYVAADARYCFGLPQERSAAELAPWMCAGLIGYRTLHMAGEARHIGIYGFGAAAHLVTQIARHQGRQVYAFTRPGDEDAQHFALALGAVWAGGSDEPAPRPLDAALLFAPVGALVPKALRDVAKGGSVVCGGIHMSDIPGFSYAHLWGERRIVSVANLTRRDGVEFIAAAQAARIHAETHVFPLRRGNEALAALREGQLTGAAVLVPD